MLTLFGGLGLESYPLGGGKRRSGTKTSSDSKVDFEAWATWDTVSKETKTQCPVQFLSISLHKGHKENPKENKNMGAVVN